jgi:nucleoside-triphosphatase THEP1
MVDPPVLMYNTFMMCETILFTGKINSGKTTRVLDAASELRAAGKSVGGIVSIPQIREGEKYAYYAYDIRTKEATLLATTEPIEDSVRFSRFFFSRSGFRFAEAAVDAAMALDFLVLDEAGPLELRGEGFAAVLRHITENYRGTFLLTVRQQILEEVISRFFLSGSAPCILTPDKEFAL